MKQLFLVLPVFFAFSAGAGADFNDLAGDPSREAVNYLQEQTVVEGFADGTFKPEKDVTRAEFLKIALKSNADVGGDCEPKKQFSDVVPEDWFFPYVCYAVNNGIIEGYADSTFKPHDNINYRDGAKIISETYDVEVPEAEGEWYAGYIEALARERVVPGAIDDAAALLSRGDMAQVVWGLKTGKEVENESLGELPEISSCADLETQIRKYETRNASSSRGYDKSLLRNFAEAGAADGDTGAVMAPETQTAEAPSAGDDSAKSADEYSGTNLQEEGVDEADIIKNDGSHIFMIKEDTVRIVKAYPTNEMKEEATVTIENAYPLEIYADGDRLTVISQVGQGGYPMPYESDARMMMPSMPYYQASQTQIDIYDIKDRTDPKSLRTVTVDGNYLSSRRIGDNVYVATDKSWSFWGMPRPLPVDTLLPQLKDTAFKEEKFVTDCGGIRYFPNFTTPDYLILTSINTRDLKEKTLHETVLGGGSTVYASTENMFVSRTVWQWPKDAKAYQSREVTEIYKFGLDDGKIAFDSKGSVEGRVLNQFSMSEYDDHFRIATQTGNAWDSAVRSSSRVTILDKDLKQTGEVTDIAPGEDMKSARFLGKRGYLVTFKTVDPLFVLDLDPTDPKLLGKLKIPGWSDYLHPYDDTHLIGFGKEVDESIDADKVHSENAVYYTAVLGMKLSIFDVTDPESPVETHKTVIGSRGTTSELLTNHKALLFDKEKGILGFPITITENKNDKVGQDADIQTVFSGAQIYDLSLEDGFELRGEVSHYEDADEYLKSGEYFYGDPVKNIQRIIYIGENFFSISPAVIKALGWEDVKEVESVELK